MELTHFSLFSGIGGIDLAAEWAGFTSVGQCEIADYPYKVLCKHWPDVPKWRDIRDVTNESVRATGVERITILSGGFPCQPFSIAGKRQGKADDRDLWPEMFRVIQELRPCWIIGENVANFVNMELERTIIDLESEGYEVQPFIIPACSVEAPHERQRVFVVANAGCRDFERNVLERSYAAENRTGNANKTQRPSRSPAAMADTNSEGLQGLWRLQKCAGEWTAWEGSRPLETVWKFEPFMGRVAAGVSSRVDRLKCLGNAVVPQQVYPILKAIADIERGGRT